MHDALIALPRGEIDWELGTDIRMNSLEAEPRRYTDTLDVSQGKLAVGFRLGECMEDPDPAAIRVFNAVYGGGSSSKLFMNVREKMSLCYFASSGCNISKGILYVLSGVDFENFEPALAEILAQLDAVKAGDITDDEFAAAKAGVVSDLLAAADSPGSLEGFWLGQNLLGLEYGPEEMAALAEDVTREQVAAIAQGVECDTIYFLTGESEDDDETA